MTKTPGTLQDLQRKIYSKAKADPSWRFWGLYVHVCKLKTLHTAYRVAKATDEPPRWRFRRRHEWATNRLAHAEGLGV
jgi:RNA-directed DNA polymerase